MQSHEIFEFIDKVHGTEFLWNISSKSYKDTQKRNHMWAEIGCKFNVSGKEAYEMFRRLREKYRRENENEHAANRRGVGLSTAPKWIYWDHLRFLDETYKKRRATDSILWTRKQPLTEPGIAMTAQTPDSVNENISEALESSTTTPVNAAKSIIHNYVQSATPPISPLPIPSNIYRPSPDSSQSSTSTCQQPPPMHVRCTKPIEQIMADNTRELINALNAPPAPKPFDSVFELVRDTLTSLNAQRCQYFEKS